MTIHIIQPRTEYLANPLGIDTLRPRLSWMLQHPERGQGQSAYQIVAASTAELLSAETPDLWDSGKVASADTLVEYAGQPLSSRQRVYWQVRAWDLQDQPGPYSETSWFELGLLEPSDWEAEWSGFPAGLPGRALYVRKTFSVEKLVKRARVYICGLGLYELRMNGQKVGDEVLDPGHTDYAKRALYTTHDVTGLLQPGGNAVGVILGNGWYGTTKMRLRLEIEHEDGTFTKVLSGYRSFGTPWMVAQGPIRENSLYIGEVYDARLERPGWDTAEGEHEPRQDQASMWVVADVVEGPGGRLVAQAQEPIRVVDSIKPVSVKQPKPGIYVLDMGQNFAGWVRLQVQGQRGQQVTLRFAESLYEDGTVNQENLRAAIATDVYILKGGALETWEPRFTYHGFRYVQVEGYPGVPAPEAIQGRVVRSAVEPAGTFACSNDLLNRIYKMVWWTENSNLHAIPTDCPQRDERMGWLNDMGARTEEALYNFRLVRFLSKWIADIADSQDHHGAITDTAPYHWGRRPADPVSACFLMIPWMLYQHYSDTYTMAEHYDAFKRWVEYLRVESDGHIIHRSTFGDWAPPVSESIEGSIGSSAVSKHTSAELVSTAFYYYTVIMLVQIAGVLGREGDQEGYRKLAGEIYDTYNRQFWDEASGGYGANNQAANAISLYFRLVPEDRRRRVLENIVHDVLDLRGGHLTTGNLSTKYLLEVLTEMGRADVAYTIATQDSYPSWGFMLANGATTVWERWELMTGGGMNSHNHPMFGSVGSWFYKALAGITVDPSGPAFARFNVRPHIVGDLTFARATLQTVRGKVEAGWECKLDGLEMRVVIPTGSRARVFIPAAANGKPFRVSEGSSVIWENGQAKGKVAGILTTSSEAEGYLMLEVGSGTYQFRREDL